MGAHVTFQVSVHVCTTQPLKTASITHLLHMHRVRETGMVRQKYNHSSNRAACGERDV